MPPGGFSGAWWGPSRPLEGIHVFLGETAIVRFLARAGMFNARVFVSGERTVNPSLRKNGHAIRTRSFVEPHSAVLGVPPRRKSSCKRLLPPVGRPVCYLERY